MIDEIAYVEQRYFYDNGEANVTVVERYEPAGPDDKQPVLLFDGRTGKTTLMRLVDRREEYGKR